MIVTQAKFVTSVANMAQYPEVTIPEITFVGRSNVGKSSLINLLAGQKSLARTSSTPGRTRLINLFEFNRGAFMLVDLPGYGYQAGSKADAKKWSALIERYLEYRKELKYCFLLLDIRHQPSEQDLHMIRYLNYLRIPFGVAATKADRVPKTRVAAQLAMLDSFAGVGIDNIVAVSAPTKRGKEELLAKIDAVLAASGPAPGRDAANG